MRVTVCQLRDDPAGLHDDWVALVDHARAHRSDLVLLPEMPFYTWFFWRNDVDRETWEATVAAHAAWLPRLAELAPARVVASRPVIRQGRRLNEGFVWDGATRPLHQKYYLPDEAGFWEASWYERGDGRFTAAEIGGGRAGLLICTDLWFMDHARAYGEAGVQLLLNPRATERQTRERWLTGGRVAAIQAGAYCLSSNHVNEVAAAPADEKGPYPLGGQGWIVDPDGDVLAVTGAAEPFVTREIDLAASDRAKGTYPRYVRR